MHRCSREFCITKQHRGLKRSKMKWNMNIVCKSEQIDFVIPGSFILIEVSYERAEIELSRNMIFSL